MQIFCVDMFLKLGAMKIHVYKIWSCILFNFFNKRDWSRNKREHVFMLLSAGKRSFHHFTTEDKRLDCAWWARWGSDITHNISGQPDFNIWWFNKETYLNESIKSSALFVPNPSPPGRRRSLNSEEMAVFYKSFLDRNRIRHANYNKWVVFAAGCLPRRCWLHLPPSPRELGALTDAVLNCTTSCRDGDKHAQEPVTRFLRISIAKWLSCF